MVKEQICNVRFTNDAELGRTVELEDTKLLQDNFGKLSKWKILVDAECEKNIRYPFQCEDVELFKR